MKRLPALVSLLMLSITNHSAFADTEFVERKFAIHELGPVPQLQKFVCGKQLYNYDNLEPSERKLVL